MIVCFFNKAMKTELRGTSQNDTGPASRLPLLKFRIHQPLEARSAQVWANFQISHTGFLTVMQSWYFLSLSLELDHSIVAAHLVSIRREVDELNFMHGPGLSGNDTVTNTTFPTIWQSMYFSSFADFPDFIMIC